MNFRRWVVFSFVIHLAVILIDKSAGFVLLALTQHRPGDKGAADLLTNLPFILTAIANLGFATSLVYFVRKRKHDVRTVAETTSLVAVVWGGLIALLGMACCAWMLPAIKPAWTFSPWLYVPVCLCVPFQLVASYFNSIQLATDHVRDYSVVHLIGSAVFLPLFLCCYYLSGEDAAQGMASSRFLAAVVMVAITLWMVRGIVRFRPRMHWDFLRDGLVFGWRANLTSVLAYLNHRLDLYLLFALYVGSSGGLTATEQVAYYGLAVTFAELVWHFPEATRDLFFSKVAGSSQEEARRMTPALARVCMAIAIVGSAGMICLANPVMGLFFTKWPDWSPHVMPCLLMLAPGTVTYTVAKILQSDLAGRGYLNSCMAASVLNLSLMITLDVMWVPAEGAYGAARASSISFLVTSVFTLWLYQRSGGAKWWDCLLLRRSDWSYAKQIGSALLSKLRPRRAEA